MKGSIEANARAWQAQLKVIRPLAYHQTIRSEDLADARTLVDFLGNDPQIKREQVIGQWASGEIKAGTILTTRMIEAAPMVKSGQLITITSEYGSVQVKAVARALESGGFGETIKVKNETTGDIYEATLTGPQAGRIGGSERPKTASISN